MTALALALAYLGTLAFAAWLFWARGIGANIERRCRDALDAQSARIGALERRPDVGELAKRVDALEHRADSAQLGRAFGG